MNYLWLHLVFLFVRPDTILPVSAQESTDFLTFLTACADGVAEKVETALQEHPDWASQASPEGETCLHVAGIHGHVEVTRAALKGGADPNLSTKLIDEDDQDGVQMHALSWHVFGGHVETTKILLEHGADPNKLMDSISQTGDNDKEHMTVLDLVEDLLNEGLNEHHEDLGENEVLPMIEMKQLLLKHGAKRMDEL